MNDFDWLLEKVSFFLVSLRSAMDWKEVEKQLTPLEDIRAPKHLLFESMKPISHKVQSYPSPFCDTNVLERFCTAASKDNIDKSLDDIEEKQQEEEQTVENYTANEESICLTGRTIDYILEVDVN